MQAVKFIAKSLALDYLLVGGPSIPTGVWRYGGP